jgi:hypothetical protein
VEARASQRQGRRADTPQNWRNELKVFKFVLPELRDDVP